MIFNLTKKNCENCFPDLFIYETFDIPDKPNHNILNIINKITQKMNEFIQENFNLVIHCHKGISRAPTMIIAYLMRYKNMKFENAFDFVKSKSDIIDPNAGFLMQLHELQY